MSVIGKEASVHKWAMGCLFVIAAVLLWRLFGLTWLFASNVPFSDQWQLWNVLFDGFQGGDFWRAYLHQHGPHRQGLSFALMVPLYQVTHWNIRLEALAIASIQVLSGLLALRLRRQLLGHPISLWDSVILLGFWGTAGYETISLTPNASHSIAPLALLLLWANLWLAPVTKFRTISLLLLTHALCFTGFGVLAMPPLLAMLLLQMWRGSKSLRPRNGVLLAGVVVSMAHFSIGYVFNPAVDNFEAVRPALLDYTQFLSALMQYFFQIQIAGAPKGWYLYGMLFFLSLCGVALLSAMRMSGSKTQPPSDEALFWSVVFLLAGTTLGFAVMTTYGRTLLGVPAAHASRYMVLLLPGFLSLYLVAFRLRHTNWIALVVLAVLMLARQGPEYRRALQGSAFFGDVKACWLASYQETGSYDLANNRVARAFPKLAFQPVWMGDPEAWEYLKLHGLGPFSASSVRWGVSAYDPNPCPP